MTIEDKVGEMTQFSIDAISVGSPYNATLCDGRGCKHHASVKRLRSFEKIELKAGESRTINFKLNLRDVAFVGIENKWITEPGEFTIRVGGLEEKVMYNEAKKTW